ncbi:VPS15 protein kinase [Phakopsora pachyrhizi]|nr:VPS15 protein kinase [Phakopsora pachyrhizi]
MGNASSNNLNRPAGLTLDSFVSELGSDVLYEKSLGSSRFLKTIRARHKCGRIVVKVFVKTNSSFSLKAFLRRLKLESELLKDIPNVLTYQKSIETEKAGYLIRQWLTNNLYDRISTRPFLSLAEKKWIAFQLLMAMRDSWKRQVPHGDIKSENVIVTSWNWVYITDFSTAFKPSYLPEDDPADFSYFFDTSSRRSCYIAPERFYPSRGADLDGPSKSKLTEAMDVFSLGCVIAEMFLDGKSPFTLSQMFNYKREEYSVEQHLRNIEDEKIRDLVRTMIQRNPEDRLTFQDHVINCRANKTFPNSFYIFLHPFLLSLQELSGISPPEQATRQSYNSGGNAVNATNKHGLGANETASPVILRNNSDSIIEKLWSEFDFVTKFLGATRKRKPRTQDNESFGADKNNVLDENKNNEMNVSQKRSTWSCTDFPLQTHVPGYHSSLKTTPEPRKSLIDDDVTLILLSVLSSTIRNCAYPSSIIKGLDLYLVLVEHLADETILDRVLPYLVSLLNINDTSSNCDLVKSKTLFCLTQVLLLVEMITPSNSSLFSEYLIPNLRHFVNEPSELVRSTLGRCIGSLSLIAKRFLNLTQVMHQTQRRMIGGGTPNLTNIGEANNDNFESTYDYNLNELQRQFQEIVVSLLTDSSSTTKRSLLTSLPDLANFFGRTKTNDILLSHLLTYLNENDWMLRVAFFDCIVEIIKETGPVSVEEYILPLMVQALADSEEFVTVRVVSSLTKIIQKELLGKPRLWELIAAVIVLLSHPNSWVRQASAQLIEAASKVLPTTDTWCILYPALRKLLKCDIEDLDEISILNNLEPPIPRIVYEAAVVWAGRKQPSSFWNCSATDTHSRKKYTSVTSQANSPARQPRIPSLPILSEDDTEQLKKLQNIGMKSVDESRLKNMRQHILKLADARARLPTPNPTLEVANLLGKSDVPLQDFGVPLHNIILKNTFASEIPPRLNSASGPNIRNARSLDVSPRKTSIDTQISFSSNDVDRPGSRLESPIVSDLRRHLVQKNLPSQNNGLAIHSPELRTTSVPVSQSSSINSADLQPLGGFLELSSGATAKPKLDAKNPGPSSKGFEISRVNPATARDKTSVFGTLDIEARPRPFRDISQDFFLGGTGNPPATEQTSHQSLNLPYVSGLMHQRFSSTYEGHDSNIRYLLERTFLDSYREPLPEFGPVVTHGIPRRKAFRAFLAPRENNGGIGSGGLVGSLVEHTAAISCLVVSPDFVFFVTGSHDGTIKVWDTVRLEKNVTSKSRHTFSLGGKVTNICMLENSHCVASASTNGTLCVHRVDVNFESSVPIYGKLELIRQHKLDAEHYITCMVHYNTTTSSNLIYTTNRCLIATLDIRTMRITQRLESPKHLGPLMRLCVDKWKIWLVVGTSRGYLSLWDLRFGLLLRTWRVANGPIYQLEVHPTQGKGRWIIIAALTKIEDGIDQSPINQVMQVWDLEANKIVQAFVVSRATFETTLDCYKASNQLSDQIFLTRGNAVSKNQVQESVQESDEASCAIELLLRQNKGKSSEDRLDQALKFPKSLSKLALRPTVHSFLVGSQYFENMSSSGEFINMPEELSLTSKYCDTKPRGYVIAAGEDRKIRFWDLSTPPRSKLISGIEVEEERPQYKLDSSGSPALYLEYIGKPFPSNSSNSTNIRRKYDNSRNINEINSRPTSSNPTIPHRSTVVANYQMNVLKNHRDCITCIGLIEIPFRCIVSGDRSGEIHIYEYKDGKNEASSTGRSIRK